MGEAGRNPPPSPRDRKTRLQIGKDKKPKEILDPDKTDRFYNVQG